jgi:hypothetical protein
MSEDVESSLIFFKTTEFSLQLDESTLPNNKSLLLAYVRFIKYEKICLVSFFSIFPERPAALCLKIL